MATPRVAESIQPSQTDQAGKEEAKKAPAVVAPVQKQNSRPKTTFNLNSIGKPKVEEKKAEEIKVTIPAEDKPIDMEMLKKVWLDFAELKKNNVAEYQLLKREFLLEDNKIIVTLNNPIEEPFLQGLRTALIGYLREKLSNRSILVVGVMREIDASRPLIYTNQEKFDYLTEKYPALKDLKDRFGLDAD